MMKRFLSIDFDYFVGCSAKERAALFPKMDETYSFEEQSALWRAAYKKTLEKLAGITIHPDFKVIEGVCRNYRGISMVEDSHKHIYQWIMELTGEEEAFEVYNIDFHHDMYCLRLGEEKVNCSNWARVLKEERPQMQYYWIKREDSEEKALGGKVEAETKPLACIKELSFDYLYLCRSSVWCPPHLDRYFTHLFAILKRPRDTKMA